MPDYQAITRQIRGWLSYAALATAGFAPMVSADTPQEAEEEAMEIQDVFAPNEPMYFVVGSDDEQDTARFQFSFMYRIFDSEGSLVEAAPVLRNMHFAYTQTSVWNLSEESAPFDDTSYRPSFFWQVDGPGGLFSPDVMRIGYEHESNGQDGLDSRSIDTLFIQPIWQKPIGDRNLTIIPRLRYYLDKDENPDIRDYRGYGDLIIRLGREESWLVDSTLRMGTEGYGSVELGVSFPMSARIFNRAGGFFYVQAFHGYGNTLVDYSQKTDFVVRVGIALVR
ncbi:phospholipase A [Marinimicrobium sp. C6131]|uniref:phospholipase A n=1 Tax=Marinimicrobium sp. C6131 TaxID=3022676 RepID=UPI00223E6169|nr:phospholipase A [Marinimicrobium sp. C6131]UZJ44351.1 phospholipase A [Marinimicrobium sp. C6131]